MNNLVMIISQKLEQRECFRQLHLSEALEGRLGVFITDKFPAPAARLKGILVFCADDPSLETYFVMLNTYDGYEDVEVIIVGRSERGYQMLGKTTHYIDTPVSAITREMLVKAITILRP